MQFPTRGRSRTPPRNVAAGAFWWRPPTSTSRVLPSSSMSSLSSLSSPSSSLVVQAPRGPCVATPAVASDGGLPALRRDAPERRPWKRGSLPTLGTEAERDQALQDLDAGFYAASSASAVRSRRRCYTQLLGRWQLEPFPANAFKLRCLGAGVRQGGYRSYSSILAQYRVDSERQGDNWEGPLRRLYADAARACKRGLGPTIQALPLPLERLRELPGDPRPWVRDGPVGPRNAIVCGAWWLTREVELATIRANFLDIVDSDVPTASLQLPASKSDVAALGVSRTHACVCGGGPAQVDCPVHSAWDQRHLLRRLFPDHHVDGSPSLSLPLFPTERGTVTSKKAMTDTILMAARILGVPLATPDGMQRISGHTLRPTGAQGLAKLGVDSWAIELLGRWGSTTVQKYVRTAAISTAAAQARAQKLHVNLNTLVAQVSPELPQARGGPLTWEDVHRALRSVLPNLGASWRSSIVAEVQEMLKQELAKRPATTEAQTQACPSPPSSLSSSSSGSGPDDPTAENEPDQGETSADVGVEEARAELKQVTEVSSSWRGQQKRHLVLIAPPPVLPASAWVTKCGWRFGVRGTVFQANASPPLCGLCARQAGSKSGGNGSMTASPKPGLHSPHLPGALSDRWVRKLTVMWVSVRIKRLHMLRPEPGREERSNRKSD